MRQHCSSSSYNTLFSAYEVRAKTTGTVLDVLYSRWEMYKHPGDVFDLLQCAVQQPSGCNNKEDRLRQY